MKKLFIGLLTGLFLFSFTTQGYCVGWVKAKPAGTDNASDIDAYVIANNTAIDLMLSKYQQGLKLSYASASTITISAGGVMTSNSDGSLRLMTANTSSTTASWSDIDTGSEASSTTYYIYAINSAITDTTHTFKISTNSSVPTSVTYYKRIGSFYNDSSGNITNITNDNNPYAIYDSGWFAVAASTLYTKTHSLGTQKLLVAIYSATDSSGTNMMLEGYHGVNVDNWEYGIKAINLSTTSISVYVESRFNYERTYSESQVTSGYCRIIMFALES